MATLAAQLLRRMRSQATPGASAGKLAGSGRHLLSSQPSSGMSIVALRSIASMPAQAEDALSRGSGAHAASAGPSLESRTEEFV